MASGISADQRDSRTINTAACLIIGDEVLGGKAGCTSETWAHELRRLADKKTENLYSGCRQ